MLCVFFLKLSITIFSYVVVIPPSLLKRPLLHVASPVFSPKSRNLHLFIYGNDDGEDKGDIDDDDNDLQVLSF